MEVLKCIKKESSFDEVKKILEGKGLIVNDYENDDIFLVKYDKNQSNMSDSDVKQCRGLIISKDGNKTICYPPNKSVKIDELPDSNIIYEEFIDGTMINVFYYNDEWKISTRSKYGADCSYFSNKTFKSLYDESSNHIDYELLNKECCYTFVLMHPENRIVKKYNKAELALVHVVDLSGETPNILDLEEVKKNFNGMGLNVIYPTRFNFKTIKDAIDYVDNVEDYEMQGIVLKHNNMRSKIRNNKYNKAKYLRGNTTNIKELYHTLRQNKDITEFLNIYPEYIDTFKNFQDELFTKTNELWDLYKKCYINKTHDKLATIPYEFRPICYELHGQYLSTRERLSWYDVKLFVNSLPVPRILFIINYQNRIDSKNKLENH